MPTISFATSRPGAKGSRVGVLVLLLLVGCSENEGSNSEDAPQLPRYRQEMRVARVALDPDLKPPEVASPPVPRDSAAQERARTALEKQLREEYPAAYERHGHKDPRWDAAAREALQAWVRFQVRPAYRELLDTGGYYQSVPFDFQVGEDQVVAWKATQRAINAECDDALILYLSARLSCGECAPNYNEYPKLARLWTSAAEAMLASKYSARVRATCLARAGEHLAKIAYNRITELPRVEEYFNVSLSLIPEIARECRENGDKSNALYHLGALLVDGCSRLPNRRYSGISKAMGRVTPVLAAEPVNRVEKLLLTADNCCRMAWNMRGHGSALEVTPDNWDRFDTWLSQAEEAITEALELDPNAPDGARLMISIETWRGEGREQMEAWFQRAMRLDGDDYRACLAKMEYLDPRWHGSEADMLAFGRECVRTENWEGRLPFLLIEAHRRIARNYLVSAQSDQGYFARPYVWNDIQSVYVPYLARHPESRYDKSCYTKFASLSGHYAIANRLFEELGVDYWHTVFLGEEYKTFSQNARLFKNKPEPRPSKVEENADSPPPGARPRPVP
jgi:hypothetical protein